MRVNLFANGSGRLFAGENKGNKKKIEYPYREKRNI
jgi:hypothetical protein